MILTPKNWNSFQHYKDRDPSWIKLHKSLLTNYEFVCLPLASKALAPMLWLLASEYKDGIINASIEKIAFRLHMTAKDLSEALTPLIESGFFDASDPLAGRYQDASLEKEDIEQKEKEDIEKRESKNRAREDALLFDLFWDEYRNKVGKAHAEKAFRSALKRASFNDIMIGLRVYIRDKPTDRQWLNPATFLNQDRWKDQPAPLAKPLSAHQAERQTGREILDDLGAYISRNGGETNSGVLRQHPGDEPEGVGGGPGGNLIELSSRRTGTGS